MAKALRKISVTAPVKPVAVKKPVAKAAVVVVSTGKDTFKVVVPPVQAPAPKAPRAPKAERVVHSVTSLYTGDSPGLNKRKSVTALDLTVFNTKPDYVLSERSELVAETIKKAYGNKPFPRANLDAGILKHLLMKGFVEPVSGSGGEDTTLRFTKAGLAYHRATA